MPKTNTKELERITNTADSFRILSDPTRCKIVYLLCSAPNGMCVNEIADAVDVSHSAVSHQLAKLEARGIVCHYRQGQTICYHICTDMRTKTLVRVMRMLNNA